MIDIGAETAITSIDADLERIVSTGGVQRATLDELLSLLEHAEGPYPASSSLPWAEQRRFELEVFQSRLLEDCSMLALQLRRFEIAERLAERSLAQDPYCEWAYRVLDTVADMTGATDRPDVIRRRAQIALAEIGVSVHDIGLGRARSPG